MHINWHCLRQIPVKDSLYSTKTITMLFHLIQLGSLRFFAPYGDFSPSGHKGLIFLGKTSCFNSVVYYFFVPLYVRGHFHPLILIFLTPESCAPLQTLFTLVCPVILKVLSMRHYVSPECVARHVLIPCLVGGEVFATI